MTDFVVVGGGVAGLVAARTLARGGASVVLLEASDRLGGTVTHHTVGGLVLDAGAESFAVRGGTVAALADELHLEVVNPSADAAWLQRGDAAFPLPATSILGIPGVPLAADVITAIGGRAAFRASLDLVIPTGYGAKATTLGEFVRKRMGRGLLERLVTPVAQGIHSADPSALELDRVAPGLRARTLREGSLSHAVRIMRASTPAGSQVAGIRGGVHLLVDALASEFAGLGVDVRFGVSVVPEDLAGSQVVSAVPSPAVTTRVTLATLVVDVPELDSAPRGTGVLVAAGSPVQAKALTHATAKWPWLAEQAAGKHVLRLSYSHIEGDFCTVAARDASVLLGVEVAAASVLDSDRVEWARSAPRTTFEDGVTYVGEATAGTGLANVIAQADAAATALLVG